ncbi:MAG: zinc ribbon domain-containing protein [Thaumarchaeota archaeon]|nr:zinc ribbon domain-containing protein [Nitrososphaerota archaeon]
MNPVLSEFEQAIGRGLFRVPECTECGAAVWPPSEFCSVCLGGVRLGTRYGDGDGKMLRGRIVECSMEIPAGRLAGGSAKSPFFCLVAFECGIRLIARFVAPTPPAPGDLVALSSCGMSPNGSGYAFEVSTPDAPEDPAGPANM